MKGSGYKIAKLQSLHELDGFLNTFIDSNNDFIVKGVVDGKVIRDTDKTNILKKIIKINKQRDSLIKLLFDDKD